MGHCFVTSANAYGSCCTQLALGWVCEVPVHQHNFGARQSAIVTLPRLLLCCAMWGQGAQCTQGLHSHHSICAIVSMHEGCLCVPQKTAAAVGWQHSTALAPRRCGGAACWARVLLSGQQWSPLGLCAWQCM